MSANKQVENREKKKLLIGCYNKSVILTYVGLVIAMIGVINTEHKDISLTCLIIAGICDLFDGVIARKCKRTDTEKAFGVQIDSLVDVISFLILPSMILIELSKIEICLKFTTIVIVSIYIIAGITRLAWFNINKHNVNGETINNYYEGLPVTYSALIIPILNTILEILNCRYIFQINLVTFILIAFLFIANIKIKKPTGMWYIIFSVLALITIVVIHII